MSSLKKLANQTAIYGLPSILGRFLNFLFVPLYTGMFAPEKYGVISEIYAQVAFIAILLPWGMETAYFRFSSHENFSAKQIFQNTLFFVFITSILFILAITCFTQDIASAIGYPNHPEYVLWMGLTLGFDALTVIPLSELRKREKAKRFAAINLSGIATNIAINLFFIYYCMDRYEQGGNAITDMFFNPAIGIGYIFIANLLQSLLKFILISRAYLKLSIHINPKVLKRLIIYASPLVIAGFAGTINETLDRILIRWLLTPTLGTDQALAQVGIYGGVYKLAILITIFTQAFRYAAEPFFFAHNKESDKRQIYAEVLKWYTIIVTTLFLGVMLYIDVIKHFIRSEAYWVGLSIVPILLYANIFLGWIYNLSIWYKLTHKTIYGAAIAVIGAIITVGMNILLIPKIGYTGAAWTTFASYGTMAVISYVLGQRFFPIPYSIGKILGYSILSVGIWYISLQFKWTNETMKYGMNTILILLFLSVVAIFEKRDLKKWFS